jgi:hypothetical protein
MRPGEGRHARWGVRGWGEVGVRGGVREEISVGSGGEHELGFVFHGEGEREVGEVMGNGGKESEL